MTIRMPGRRTVVLLGLTLLLGSLTGVATAARPAPPEPARLDHAAQVGRGEKLILVLAGSYPTAAAATAAAASMSLGDVAGFYVDAAANYRLIGAYDQSTPDVISVRCAEVADAPHGCAAGGGSLRAMQDVTLRYLPLAALPAFLARDPGRCDAPDAPPCIAARLRAVMGATGLGFEPGSYLVLSAFRTKPGAELFATWARDHGVPIVAVRAIKTAGGYVGLGQEPHPDGSGPLLDPPADPDAVQR